MDNMLYYNRPSLRSPVMLLALAGWPDAAQGATHALRYLLKGLKSEKFAEMDPEEFYDFSQTRPHAGFGGNGERTLRWQPNDFFAWSGHPHHSDLVIYIGVEPQLKWKTFTQVLLDVARDLAVTRVIYFGALLDAMPHTRTAQVTGDSWECDGSRHLEQIGVQSSGYEGPTGLGAVLFQACRAENIPLTSLWGHSPHYMEVVPNPKVSVSLLEKLQEIVRLDINLEELRAEAVEFEHLVEQTIAAESELTTYIRRLEKQYDASTRHGPSDIPDAQDMIRDLEEFFRHRRQKRHGDEGHGDGGGSTGA